MTENNAIKSSDYRLQQTKYKTNAGVWVCMFC